MRKETDWKGVRTSKEVVNAQEFYYFRFLECWILRKISEFSKRVKKFNRNFEIFRQLDFVKIVVKKWAFLNGLNRNMGCLVFFLLCYF